MKQRGQWFPNVMKRHRLGAQNSSLRGDLNFNLTLLDHRNLELQFHTEFAVLFNSARHERPRLSKSVHAICQLIRSTDNFTMT